MTSVGILVGGTFHALRTSHALVELGYDVTIFSAAPRRYFRGLSDKVATRFAPMPATSANRLLRTGIGLQQYDAAIFDNIGAVMARNMDVLHGYATCSLRSGRAVQKRGGQYILDRACPHVHFQQRIVAEEAKKLRYPWRPNPPALIARELAEYETADRIVVPSDYVVNSFLENGIAPERLFKAPLGGRLKPRKTFDRARGQPFTVGCVGAGVLRKGFLYLFEAWRAMALPNARLLIRADPRDLRKSPVLTQLLSQMDNIEIVEFFEDMNDFYEQIDVFCLPSVDDGFGMVVSEALVNGIPVVATTHVGAAEAVRETEAGIVVEPFSARALADALIQLYEDELLRTRMAHNARRFGSTAAESDIYRTNIGTLYAELTA